MTATNFFTKLINLGLRPQETTVLEAVFESEPEFTEGLEIISTWVSLKQIPPVAKPKGQPWLTIYDEMLTATQAGVDLDTAYSDSLKSYPSDMQIAITKAISVRMKAILDFEQSKGNKKRFKSKDFINQLQQFGYNFRYNVITDIIEVNGSPMTDGLAATIRMQLRDEGMTRTVEAEDAYLSYAWHNRFHPIHDYLSSLAWDGQQNIEKLASYFIDEYAMFNVWLRKWLIGTCAKTFMTPKNPVQVPMLVLDGPQNLGKSQFTKYLASPLTEYYFEGAINPDEKDCLIRVASKWIWEVSELGATTRKADQEALKAFLTYESIKVRRPYGRNDIEKPALASFIGTVNNYSGLFSDPTGSRRYLISKILSIDWDYSALDINQIWAEAMAAYLAGEDWHTSQTEYQKSNEINANYDVDDPVEDLIKKYFYIDPDNQAWWTSTTDIIHILEDPDQGAVRSTTRLISLSISSFAAKEGLKKGLKRNYLNQLTRGYYGIQISNQVP